MRENLRNKDIVAKERTLSTSLLNLITSEEISEICKSDNALKGM